MGAGQTIVVLGGGITGLAAAYRLHTQGHAVTLLEAAPRTGGAIRTELTDGWLIEAGPNSFQPTQPEVTALLTELGLDAEVVPASPKAKKRFLVRGGRVLAAPMSPPAFLGTPLFSGATKLGILRELFTRPRSRPADVSVAEFVRDHFGQELLDYAVQPLIGGIYAGDPAQLSTQHGFPTLWESERTHGSVIRGMIAGAKARRREGRPRAALMSFRRGLQVLPDTLAARLPAGAVRLGARVESLTAAAGRWKVAWNAGGTAREQAFDAVLSALPAGGIAGLRLGESRPFAPLAEVFHPPVTSLFLGYRRDQVRHPLDGFGVLIPALEKRAMLGVLFSSTLFPGRAPEGHVALTVMVGGSLHPELAPLPEAELLARVAPDLRELLGVAGDPVFSRLKAWPRAIPQYNLGHGRYLDLLATAEQQHRGLFFAGQVRDGIALPACAASGLKAAARLHEFVGA
jgi:oxygen-dependent protoporphyrinogen oxidase